MDHAQLSAEAAVLLRKGQVIPAHPLALTTQRTLDERAQCALTRYYVEAGAGGLAVGVHTTQFAIREAGLLEPVLGMASATLRQTEAAGGRRLLRVAGVCGPTAQAVSEAELARDLGYDLGLLSLAALGEASDDELLEHARVVGEVLPLFGFYLQTAVGGRPLSRTFWSRFAALPAVAAIKVAPFDRALTRDVVEAVADSGRADEVVLYTGNDDHIVMDLLGEGGRSPFVGGLLGHWAVWTRTAVALFESVRRARASGEVPPDLHQRAKEVSDMNAALFDTANNYRGCLAGVQTVLHGQGLLASPLCLNPQEGLSDGQRAEIDRVRAAYPHLLDDEFVAENRDRWLA